MDVFRNAPTIEQLKNLAFNRIWSQNSKFCFQFRTQGHLTWKYNDIYLRRKIIKALSHDDNCLMCEVELWP